MNSNDSFFLNTSGPILSVKHGSLTDCRRNTKQANPLSSVKHVSLTTLKCANSNCLESEPRVFLSWPQMVSGLRSLYLNSTMRRFELSLWLLNVLLFLRSKNSREGRCINALAARINLASLSAEIAAPRFLLCTMGSMIMI